MSTRRKFVKQIGSGLAVSSVAFSPLRSVADEIFGDKKIRIGIIGAENSHSSHFGRIFNIDKQFPGVEVTHIWGETKKLADSKAAKYLIPNTVNTPSEMLGKIDALIVDHRHPKFHLKPAIPFIKEGVPTFIDKPFCFNLKEGISFLELAKEYGTPVTSFSTIAHSAETFDIKNQLQKLGDINEIVRLGPADLDSQHGGIFFYGVHLVQPLLYMFDDDVERVKITRIGNKGSAALVFKNGLFATLVFKTLSYGWSTYVDTKEGTIELKSDISEPSPTKADSDIVKMFRTGEKPRSYSSILKCVAILEALYKSAQTENWVYVEKVTI